MPFECPAPSYALLGGFSQSGSLTNSSYSCWDCQGVLFVVPKSTSSRSQASPLMATQPSQALRSWVLCECCPQLVLGCPPVVVAELDTQTLQPQLHARSRAFRQRVLCVRGPLTSAAQADRRSSESGPGVDCPAAGQPSGSCSVASSVSPQILSTGNRLSQEKGGKTFN